MSEATQGLLPQSREWLTAALDPFHDAPLRVEGYPGLEARKSVTTVFKSTFTLEGGATDTTGYQAVELGINDTTLKVGSNEVTIQFSPVTTADQSVYTLPYLADNPPGVNRPFDLTTPSTTAWGPSPITVCYQNSTGATTGYRVFPKVPELPFRVIAIGYEITDVTPDMYKQGMIYVSSAPLTSIQHNVWVGPGAAGGVSPESLRLKSESVVNRSYPTSNALASAPRVGLQGYLPVYHQTDTTSSLQGYLKLGPAAVETGSLCNVMWRYPDEMAPHGELQEGFTTTVWDPAEPDRMVMTTIDSTGNPRLTDATVESRDQLAAELGNDKVLYMPTDAGTVATAARPREMATIDPATFALEAAGAPSSTWATAPVTSTWLASTRNATQSLLLQDTTEWNLSKGAYIVPRMIAEPTWDSSANLDILAPSRSALTRSTQSGKQMLLAKEPGGTYWALCAGSTNSWAECTANVTGANFVTDPNSPADRGYTRLVVTVRMFCEILPSVQDTTLMTLARPAAPYDPNILAVYSHARNKLPLATGVKNNAVGGWLALVAAAIKGVRFIATWVKARRAAKAAAAAKATSNG